LLKWKAFIEYCIYSKEEEYFLIKTIETYCGNNPRFNSAFHSFIWYLYTEEINILQEDTIFKWEIEATQSLINY
jgi:hypothetical protein